MRYAGWKSTGERCFISNLSELDIQLLGYNLYVLWI